MLSVWNWFGRKSCVTLLSSFIVTDGILAKFPLGLWDTEFTAMEFEPRLYTKKGIEIYYTTLNRSYISVNIL